MTDMPPFMKDLLDNKPSKNKLHELKESLDKLIKKMGELVDKVDKCKGGIDDKG